MTGGVGQVVLKLKSPVVAEDVAGLVGASDLTNDDEGASLVDGVGVVVGIFLGNLHGEKWPQKVPPAAPRAAPPMPPIRVPAPGNSEPATAPATAPAPAPATAQVVAPFAATFWNCSRGVPGTTPMRRLAMSIRSGAKPAFHSD